MKEIQIFGNPAFGEVRVTMENNEPMFCLADVCKVLELHSNVVKQRLQDDVCSTYPIVDNLGRQQFATFVNEDGLYDVILDSRKPEAKKFRKWVTSEVLPSIRKHGAYATENTIESIIANPENGIKLLQALKDEQDKRKAIEAKAQEQRLLIEEQKPKVTFANAVIGSKGTLLIGELAKLLAQNGIEVGQKRLFAWLREKGYLGTAIPYYNIPNQRYVEQGLFEIKEGVRSGNDGEMHPTITTKVTGKGQEYFINGFLSGRFNIA